MTRVNVINVYAPQSNRGKRELWEKLTQVISVNQGWWIVFGDFNAVRELDERKNSRFDPVCARNFNDFLDNTGLREYSLKGMKYTYLVNRRGVCKMSRIDRFFVCDGIFNKWPTACVRALKREYSDHAPLCLSLVDNNFSPKPFRWFDSWVDRPGCDELVLSVLSGLPSNGPPDVNLMRKLGVLRDKLRAWIKDIRSKDNEEINRLNKEKEDMERIMEQRDMDEAELWVWAECKKCLQEIDYFRHRDTRQKSRVKWVALGDENTSFFHSIINGRKATNAIPGLVIRDEWISKPW